MAKAKLTIEIETPKSPTPKVSRKMPIEEYLAKLTGSDEEDGEEIEEGEGMGKIATILRLYKRGYTQKEIIGAGFNKSTVYRQVGEYRKLNGGPVKSYYGLEAYEGRILRVMRNKKLSREDAAEFIAAKDAEEDKEEA